MCLNQCEVCNEFFYATGDKESQVSWGSIEQTGKCEACFEEFGNHTPAEIKSLNFNHYGLKKT